RLTGPCGVSVVEVLSSGETRIAPSTVAPVRWESLGAELTEETTWETLVEQMSLTLLDREPDSDDELWIIRWKLRGHGPLIKELQSQRTQRELADLIEVEVAGHHETRRVHQFLREPHWDLLRAAEEDSLTRTYIDIVDEAGAATADAVRGELLNLDWGTGTQRRVLAHLLDETSTEELLADAKSAGLVWLT
ncbi:MAG: hypothetical protein KDE30_13175, partial [Novosphingobium sp.]|nr:hypothetical protein [Novosphingobium sp.]